MLCLRKSKQLRGVYIMLLLPLAIIMGIFGYLFKHYPPEEKIYYMDIVLKKH